jgi:hypothetical protein
MDVENKNTQKKEKRNKRRKKKDDSGTECVWVTYKRLYVERNVFSQGTLHEKRMMSYVHVRERRVEEDK